MANDIWWDDEGVWAEVVNHYGNKELLGPFDSEDDAEEAIRNVQV